MIGTTEILIIAGVVLLLHGYAEHSGRHAWVMARLAEAGLAVTVKF